ncbi:MAG: iron-containing alcohol dehydrogenase, partial [Spirochaetales bacterium]
MIDFTLQLPTKIIFGKDAIAKLGGEASRCGKRALLVYGQGSIKRNGVYDEVITSLADSGITIDEHAGVRENPSLAHAEEGVRKAVRQKAEMIIAVGGGSVIDEGKGIAIGCVNQEPLWDFYTRKAEIKDALPILAVQTMPATSSETNFISVLTNEKTRQKFSARSEKLFPRAAFLDPQKTLSIAADQTACACTDIMAHLMEGYLTSTDTYAPVQDGIAEGIIKAVMGSMERLIGDPGDYNARSAVMWAGALAWSGLCSAGLGGASVPNHMLEHPLSALYDIRHGAGLSVIFPAWLSHGKDRHVRRIELFGKNVLGLPSGSGPEEITAALKSWYRKIGMPVTMKEAGIEEPDIPAM